MVGTGKDDAVEVIKILVLIRICRFNQTGLDTIYSHSTEGASALLSTIQPRSALDLSDNAAALAEF